MKLSLTNHIVSASEADRKKYYHGRRKGMPSLQNLKVSIAVTILLTEKAMWHLSNEGQGNSKEQKIETSIRTKYNKDEHLPC